MTKKEKAKAYDEALERAREIKSKILSSHLSTESCKAVSEYIDTIIPELAESEDENLKNKSGYYKAGKFWKASTLWNAVKGKSPQRVPNRYILQECTWNISSLQHFADEVRNVQEVDLNYPIILDINGNILDGAHRVVKAYLEGKDIDIVYLGDDEWPEPDYDEEKAVKESEDERMRKLALWFLRKYKEVTHYPGNSEEGVDMVIAWLEKQKERKPTDVKDPFSNANFVRGYESGYADAKREQNPVEKSINWTELTWKDIVELEGIINNVHYEFRNGIGQESFGKEVLEKFREYKGDEYLDEIEQKPVELSKEDYVKKFKALCDAYEIKLPNREYDIYHLCDDLSKLFIDSGKKPVEESGTAEPDYGICDDYIPASLHHALKRHGWYATHIGEKPDKEVIKYVEATMEQKPIEPELKIPNWVHGGWDDEYMINTVISRYSLHAEVAKKHGNTHDYNLSKAMENWLRNVVKPLILKKQEEQKPSTVEKLREISTPADENWFDIQKQWEKEDEQKKPKDPFDDEQFKRGYEAGRYDGYQEGYKAGMESTSYHFPVMPTPPSGFGCDGIHCTNPHYDCINCPRNDSSAGRITTVGTGSISLSTNDSSNSSELKATNKSLDEINKETLAEQKPAEPAGKLSREEYLYQLLIDHLITYSDYEYLTRKRPAEWSEEDERMFNCCLRALKFFKDFGKKWNTGLPKSDNYFDLDKIVYPEEVESWIKSLPSRIALSQGNKTPKIPKFQQPGRPILR